MLNASHNLVTDLHGLPSCTHALMIVVLECSILKNYPLEHTHRARRYTTTQTPSDTYCMGPTANRTFKIRCHCQAKRCTRTNNPNNSQRRRDTPIRLPSRKFSLGSTCRQRRHCKSTQTHRKSRSEDQGMLQTPTQISQTIDSRRHHTH